MPGAYGIAVVRRLFGFCTLSLLLQFVFLGFGFRLGLCVPPLEEGDVAGAEILGDKRTGEAQQGYDQWQ